MAVRSQHTDLNPQVQTGLKSKKGKKISESSDSRSTKLLKIRLQGSMIILPKGTVGVESDEIFKRRFLL